MPVKPEVQHILDLINRAEVGPIADQTPEQLRTGFDQLAILPGPDVAAVSDHAFDGPHGSIAARLYRPIGSSATDLLAVLVWFHGGGFVVGNLETADSTCRELANLSGAAVVSIDYHLAPEAPFPAAVDDAMAALQWVASHAGDLLVVDASRLAVGGDSAGGNLATVVSQLARDAGGPSIDFQLLVYPVTDPAGSHPSTVENGQGYFLEAATMDWFMDHYLGDADATDPRVSPLGAADLSGLPRAYVLTAEFDPLRDEGEAYADALSASGVTVERIRYDGLIHGFFGMDFLPDCAVARTRAADALRDALQ